MYIRNISSLLGPTMNNSFMQDIDLFNLTNTLGTTINSDYLNNINIGTTYNNWVNNHYYPEGIKILQNPNIGHINFIGFNTKIGNSFVEMNFTEKIFDTSLVNGLLSITSSSNADSLGGSGINTLLINGLDQNYNQISEVINLNGTTRVLSSNNFHRVNSLLCTSIGTNGGAVGKVNINTNNNSNTHTTIEIDDSTAYIGRYCVPAGHSCYFNGVNFSAGSNDELIMKLKFKIFGLPYQDSGLVMFSFQTMASIVNNIFDKIPEKTDIIAVVKTTGSGTNHKGTFNSTGYLIPNDLDMI